MWYYEQNSSLASDQGFDHPEFVFDITIERWYFRRVGEETNVKNYLTVDQLKAFLQCARDRGTREWTIFLLAYGHGLRASEVANLTLHDVDLKNGQITIRRLKGSLRTTQDLLACKGKTLLNERYALSEWLKARPQTDNDALFPSRKTGRAMDRFQINWLFAQVAEQAGLPKQLRHPHVLKHSRAHHLLKNNVDIAAVKQALGHKSILSTAKYLKVDDAEASEAMQRVQNLL